MKREIFVTADGSKSIRVSDWNEHYHSKHGALQEAKHVFIQSGLEYYLQKESKKAEIHILECGLGTHLNALLTAEFAQQHQQKVIYRGIEAYPISKEEWRLLNYEAFFLDSLSSKLTRDLFEAEWHKLHPLSAYFSIEKQNIFFQEIRLENEIDLIYYDAFGPRVQPELWKKEIFKILFKALRNRGVFVTYSAKGSVRRALQTIGFKVEKIKGPPGKREMLRAVKTT